MQCFSFSPGVSVLHLSLNSGISISGPHFTIRFKITLEGHWGDFCSRHSPSSSHGAGMSKIHPLKRQARTRLLLFLLNGLHAKSIIYELGPCCWILYTFVHINVAHIKTSHTKFFFYVEPDNTSFENLKMISF